MSITTKTYVFLRQFLINLLEIIMNVDKFGHHVHKRLRSSEILCDISNKILAKNLNGDFHLKSVKLIGLRFPELPDEAVNKQYVDQRCELFCKQDDIFLELGNIKGQLQLLQKQINEKCRHQH